MKQTFKLTESELHNLISECITEAIEDEALVPFFGGMAKKLGRDAGPAMSNVGNRMAQGAKNMGNRIAQWTKNAYQSAKDYGQSLYNAGVQQSNISDAQTAIRTIQGLVKKGILGQNIANMVVGNLRKYGNQ